MLLTHTESRVELRKQHRRNEGIVRNESQTVDQRTQMKYIILKGDMLKEAQFEYATEQNAIMFKTQNGAISIENACEHLDNLKKTYYKQKNDISSKYDSLIDLTTTTEEITQNHCPDLSTPTPTPKRKRRNFYQNTNSNDTISVDISNDFTLSSVSSSNEGN